MILRVLNVCSYNAIRFLNFNGNKVEKLSMFLPNIHCTKLGAVIPFTSNSSLNYVCMSTIPPDIKSENSNKDEERMKLEKWIEMLSYCGWKVPQNINENNFQDILDIESRGGRKRYLKILWQKENYAENATIRKEQKKEIKKIEKEERAKQNIGHIEYGLWKNTMFAKTRQNDIVHFYNLRLAHALIHGQPLILDLGFGDHMNSRELKSLCNQLVMTICLNRKQRYPFNLIVCNTHLESNAMQRLNKGMPGVLSPKFPMDVSSKSYLDLFPKEKLVYLTPNAKNVMTKFDFDAIYIIGGIVECAQQKPLTLAKARKEGIKMKKFPLDRYLKFKGNKSLTVDVVVAVLSDLRKTGDWKIAFENIPRRLLYTATDKHD